MRILYLHQYYKTPAMNGGTRSYEMAKRLAAKGHDVVVVTSQTDSSTMGKGWYLTIENGVKVWWLPVEYSNSMPYYKRVIAFLKFALGAAIKGMSLKADIVFATSTPLTIALPALLISKIKRIPMVFEVRDLWPELPIAVGALNSRILIYFAKKLEKLAYHSSEAVVALSPGMKEGVVRQGYAAERVAIIPNACDNDNFVFNANEVAKFRSERSWLGSRPLLVYPGTFGRINGVDYAVRLAESVYKLNPEVRILLIGEGAEKQKVIDLAKAVGVYGKNLFIESAQSKATMPTVFSSATMIISMFVDLPEMRANSSNKFFDALASSKPIVVNYGGWQASLIDRHKCGLVAWNKSMDLVAKDVVATVSNEELLGSMGDNSKRLAIDLFDRSKAADCLNSVINLAVEKKGRFVSVVGIDL